MLKILEDIIQKIIDQQVVLILGPGFIPDSQKNLHFFIQNKLSKHHSLMVREGYSHYYERDCLFSFTSATAKAEAQSFAAQFYNQFNAHLDSDIVEKIVHIPFSLIISTFPDKSLLGEFFQREVDVKFDYFSPRKKVNEYEITKPNSNTPLLYNICGSIEDRESLILDFEDVLRHQKELLAGTMVPLELRSTLERATTYIFLGFQLEKWQTQMLIRYLNSCNDFKKHNNSFNYANIQQGFDDDVELFIKNEFNVMLINPSFSLLNELLNTYKEKNVVQPSNYPIRGVRCNFSIEIKRIIDQIAQDNFMKAFSLFKEAFPELEMPVETELIMIQNKYNSNERDKHLKPAFEYGLVLKETKRNLLNLLKKAKNEEN